MFKKFILAFSVMLIAGCTTYSSVETGITLLEGQKIDIASSYFGLPDDKYALNGKDVYVWKHEGTGTYSDGPLTTYGGYGSRGGFGGVGIVFGSSNANKYSYLCTIKAQTNQDQVIEKIEYNRSTGGCTKYNEAIKAINNDLKAGQ